MAKSDVSALIPSVFQPTHLARNRLLPQAGLFARIARGYNAVACRQSKLVLCKSQGLRALNDNTDGFAWPFFFRTSDTHDMIDAYVGLVASTGTDDAAPTVSLELTRAAAGGEFLSRTITFAPRDIGHTVGAGHLAHKGLRITGLLPNTEYAGIFRFTNGARLTYATVVETMKREADDEAFAVVTNPSEFVNTGPIKATHQFDLNTAAVNLWRHNAGHLFSWTSNYSADASENPQIASDDYAPIMGASGPSFVLNLANRGTLQRPNAIPIRMAAYVVMSGGTQDMRFRIRSDTGETAGFDATVSGFDPGSPPWPWVVGSAILPDVNRAWTMEADTGGRLAAFAGWSIYQWEA